MCAAECGWSRVTDGRDPDVRGPLRGGYVVGTFRAVDPIGSPQLTTVTGSTVPGSAGWPYDTGSEAELQRRSTVCRVVVRS